MSIFVGNLPFRAEQEDVIELFAQFGEVTNCALPLERDTGRKRGFAFIEMADESTEEAAIEGLQGAELMGRPLRINKAEPRGSAPVVVAAVMAAAAVAAAAVAVAAAAAVAAAVVAAARRWWWWWRWRRWRSSLRCTGLGRPQLWRPR